LNDFFDFVDCGDLSSLKKVIIFIDNHNNQLNHSNQRFRHLHPKPDRSGKPGRPRAALALAVEQGGLAAESRATGRHGILPFIFKIVDSFVSPQGLSIEDPAKAIQRNYAERPCKGAQGPLSRDPAGTRKTNPKLNIPNPK